MHTSPNQFSYDFNKQPNWFSNNFHYSLECIFYVDETIISVVNKLKKTFMSLFIKIWELFEMRKIKYRLILIYLITNV